MSITLPPLPDKWLKMLRDFKGYLHAEQFSANSLDAYCRDIAHFMWWQLNLQPQLQPGQLMADMVKNYRQTLRVLGKQPVTINRHLVALRKFFSWAAAAGLLENNTLTDIVSVEKPERLCPLGITQDETKAMLAAVSTLRRGHLDRNIALLQLFLQTGILVNEAAGLLNADIDLRERSGTLHIRAGESARVRDIPLNRATVAALKTYRETKIYPASDAAFFLTERKTPLNVRSMQRVIHQLADNAGIHRLDVSPQTLRHTFALAYLHTHPTNLTQLAALLGHTRIESTAIYQQAMGEPSVPLTVSGVAA